MARCGEKSHANADVNQKVEEKRERKRHRQILSETGRRLTSNLETLRKKKRIQSKQEERSHESKFFACHRINHVFVHFGQVAQFLHAKTESRTRESTVTQSKQRMFTLPVRSDHFAFGSRKRLEESGFSTLYLDGETPAGERLTMVDRFNGGEGQIFLISLKAGGSGLNLTGADMVILYDPWWNPAAEEQATDRAHRIGQEKKVTVIRLVTGETIEEQVVELGARKKALFERLITPGETVLSGMSEQEIRALFE